MHMLAHKIEYTHACTRDIRGVANRSIARLFALLYFAQLEMVLMRWLIRLHHQGRQALSMCSTKGGRKMGAGGRKSNLNTDARARSIIVTKLERRSKSVRSRDGNTNRGTNATTACQR